MTDSSEAWLTTGRGRAPRPVWSFTADAPLTGFDVSRETGEVLIADHAGGLGLLERSGRMKMLSRGFHRPGSVAWSDGGYGVVAVDGNRLCYVDDKLRLQWSLDFQAEIHRVAITPAGNHVAAALSSSATVVYDRHGNRVTRFTTPRPLQHVAFVVESPQLVGTANYGVLTRHTFDGNLLWQESVLTNVGGVAVSGSGNLVALAAYNHGVQFYDESGRSAGSLIVEGTPERVAISYDGKRVLSSTVEGHLYWMHADGRLVWGAETPEPVHTLHCTPLGDAIVIAFESGRVVRLDWNT